MQVIPIGAIKIKYREKPSSKVKGHLRFVFIYSFWSVVICSCRGCRPRITANVFQARAVPVVRKVKCTNVQRNAKMQNEQAWILLGVIGRFYFLTVQLPLVSFTIKVSVHLLFLLSAKKKVKVSLKIIVSKSLNEYLLSSYKPAHS